MEDMASPVPIYCEVFRVTYVDTSDIGLPMFLTILFFLIVIGPLLSIGVLRLFQTRKRSGLTYIISAIATYVVFMAVLNLVPLG